MRLQFLAAAAALALFICGCETPAPTANPSNPSAGDHGHDHAGGDDHAAHDDHGHAPAEEGHAPHGPAGGHLLILEGGQYQIEWKQFMDNDVIKMYILDNDLKPVPMKVDEFNVMPLAGNDPTPFELEAVDVDEDGKSAVYALDDKGLRMGINLGVKIEIVAGEETLTGTIDAHEPLDH
jgi:hypothetical protein